MGARMRLKTSCGVFIPSTLCAAWLMGLLSCTGQADGSAPAPSPKGKQGMSGSPYDWRGLTIEPSATEPVNYATPSIEDRLYHTRSGPLTTPPEHPRMIAEWEPVQGAVVRYPLGISVDTVKLIATELPLYVLCATDQQGAAKQAFRQSGVRLDNIRFVTCVTDTYWVRDYSAWWIEAGPAGARKIQLVDTIYRTNGERPNDDQVPAVLASYFNFPHYYFAQYVCQGGNIMTDHAHGGASTDRIQDENPALNPTKLQQMGQSMLGLRPYFITQDPAYPEDYIKHVDCWAKFIPGNRVIVKRVPAGSRDHEKFETAAQAWSRRTNAAGQPYEVIRIDGLEDSPYCNHVVLNDRVLVPIKSIPADKTALDQIKAAYGSRYRVIGVTAPPNAPWLGTDSLHCRLNSVPVLGKR